MVKKNAEQKKTLRNIIFKFLRDRHGSKRGVMVAVCNDTNYAIGVSCANINAGDAFDRKRGMEMAEGRAWKALELAGDTKKISERAIRLLKKRPSVLGEREIETLLVDVKVPGSVLQETIKFKDSAGRYFKGRTCVVKLHGPWMEEEDHEIAKLGDLFDDGVPSRDKFTPPSLRNVKSPIPKLTPEMINALRPRSFEDLANELAKNLENGGLEVAPVRKSLKKVVSKKARK